MIGAYCELVFGQQKGSPEAKLILSKAQVLSYKYLISTHLRNLRISIPIDEVCDMFDQLLLDYNRLEEEAVNLLFNDEKQYGIIKKVIARRSNKIKRQRKLAKRISKECGFAYTNNWYGRDPLTKENIQYFHNLFKESFLTIRTSLSTRFYKAIPDDLQVQLDNGDYEKIKELYILDESTDRYRIQKGMSRQLLTRIQIMIAPYVVCIRR